ncbi:glutamine amidotransferase-related protein [Limibacillus halophilus]|uniref:CTP synthase (glutamine hydrolyzing) n=1 Tax=Limibacillus halophilus TaxID=1579333 RepID=A0A839SSB7_9PROT|nr:gamma-glutamyl-gamma-aminobutyrate hydrolase family protein [Limibacillus halophilus]MBB3065362.1 CTP synthase [Limibacillus halophilus]
MNVPLILVEHHTGDPSDDCVVAAELHAVLQGIFSGGAAFSRIVGPQTDQDPNAYQHVSACGTLMGNQWLWPERLSDLSADPALEFSETGVSGPGGGIIACNNVVAPGLSVDRLMHGLQQKHHVLHVRVESQGRGLTAYLQRSGLQLSVDVIGRWTFDDYCRPRLSFLDLSPLELPTNVFSKIYQAGDVAPENRRARPSVLIVGEEQRLRRQYPALLAAIGDAGDLLKMKPHVEIVSPRNLEAAEAEEAVHATDAVLLPGGCDNSQVDGQIRIAAAALRGNTPTLGSCFGMQTMVTAFVRERLGNAGAHLQEIEPSARPLTFVQNPGPNGSIRHRLGAKTFTVLPGTQARSIYQSSLGRERMHHRHSLALDLWQPLSEAGLIISGRSEEDRIADVIELPGHAFYLGIQGHPELSSSAARPHPAFIAFLAAAAANSLS